MIVSSRTLNLFGNVLLEDAWYDRKMRPGDDWLEQISDHLDQADIIILLVSSNYFASDFCALEAERAMELHNEGKAVVIPVMLRACNLSGAVFSHLNTCPPVDRPIHSPAWLDQDQALATVSAAVEQVAREHKGSALPKNKLLHANRAELAKLLHHLCNRGPQRDALLDALRPENRKAKARRPFVIIMQGRQSDSLEWFLNRLENVLLPRLIDTKPGRLSPLIWPDYSPKKTPSELFLPRLVDCLSVSPYAKLKQINDSLPAQNAVNLLPSSIPARDWAQGGELLFNAYLSLWEEDWPRLSRDYALIPVLAIEYPAGEKLDERISQHLSAIDFATRPKLAGVVLPPLRDVLHNDFKAWIQHEKVRSKFASPEKAIEKSNQLHTQTFPTPMHPLAELHLPQFLEKL